MDDKGAVGAVSGIEEEELVTEGGVAANPTSTIITPQSQAVVEDRRGSATSPRIASTTVDRLECKKNRPWDLSVRRIAAIAKAKASPRADLCRALPWKN